MALVVVAGLAGTSLFTSDPDASCTETMGTNNYVSVFYMPGVENLIISDDQLGNANCTAGLQTGSDTPITPERLHIVCCAAGSIEPLMVLDMQFTSWNNDTGSDELRGVVTRSMGSSVVETAARFDTVSGELATYTDDTIQLLRLSPGATIPSNMSCIPDGGTRRRLGIRQELLSALINPRISFL